jgi:hypothetical protein
MHRFASIKHLIFSTLLCAAISANSNHVGALITENVSAKDAPQLETKGQRSTDSSLTTALGRLPDNPHLRQIQQIQKYWDHYTGAGAFSDHSIDAVRAEKDRMVAQHQAACTHHHYALADYA